MAMAPDVALPRLGPASLAQISIGSRLAGGNVALGPREALML